MNLKIGQRIFLILLSVCLYPVHLVQADKIDEAINTLKSVQSNGEGNVQAVEALKVFQSADEQSLTRILKGLNKANEYSANYLLSAFESVAARSLKESGKLPQKDLEEFVLDVNNSPRARRVAYEWILKVDPELENRLIPKMLKDPSSEFRRDAVERLVKNGKKLLEEEKKEEAKVTYEEALTGAVDEDQVTVISKQLKELGIEVDLQKHFGILPEWKIVGPFENKDGVGFDAVYGPEKEVDFSKSFQGKEGEVKWQTISTEDDHGLVDIAEDIHNHKAAVMYVAFEFESEESRDVVLKFGTPNAWKIWINGNMTASLKEYHRGTRFDQHRIPARLQAGKNLFLIKLCQNEQTESWAQKYQFQIRVCDPTGTAVHPVN